MALPRQGIQNGGPQWKKRDISQKKKIDYLHFCKRGVVGSTGEEVEFEWRSL